ncbi:MAG: crossover junction endodeoxyribonuclease RuvC [Gammaproteobacteria bacterium]
MRVLGIDPGSRATGWGIIDGDGRHSVHVASGVLKLGDGDLGPRLRTIFEGITRLIVEFRPTEIAIERVFMARNADSALKLGQARGAAICAALADGLPLAEYAPREIKLAVVGTGGASKEQVQHMMRIILKLDAPPQADQADALAVAVCHAHSRTLAAVGVR